MICPWCRTGIRLPIEHASPAHPTNVDLKLGFDIAHGFCPECSQVIVLLRSGRYWEETGLGGRYLPNPSQEQIIPRTEVPRRVAPEVPKAHQWVSEAAAVLHCSPKASAALSRRILQRVLVERFGIERPTLAAEIDEFLKRPGIPSHLTQAIDAIRSIGNFATHPATSQHSGEDRRRRAGGGWLAARGPGFAFDFAFVQPKPLAVRRAALNEKLELASINKPPLKG